MKNERYPKIAYNGYVPGTRKRGRQKRWIDRAYFKRFQVVGSEKIEAL